MKNREFYRFGLMGWPLRHSYSPVLHQAALSYLNLQGEYNLYPIPPSGEGQAKIANLLESMASGEINGLNVTIPYKEAVIPFLDELTSVARTIGSVNTIKFQDGKLVGDNTDAQGFLRAVSGFLLGKFREQRGESKTSLVLGAGGSARAAGWALIQDGWKLIIAARRIEQAEKLVSDLFTQNKSSKILKEIFVTGLTESGLGGVAPDLIVNTTPVGMSPDINRSPWPENLPFPRHAAVFDLIYNPTDTLLVKQARNSGLLAETGIEMLIEQAVLAFSSWTGRDIPTRVMRAAYHSFVRENTSVQI